MGILTPGLVSAGLRPRIIGGRLRVAWLLVAGIASAGLIGCEDAQAQDEARLAADSATVRRLEQIGRAVTGAATVAPDDFAFVTQAARDYPQAQLPRAVLRQALIARSDWEALVTLLGAESALSTEDRLLAASAHVRLGDFERALALVAPVVDEQPDHLDAIAIVAHSRYGLGEAATAIAELQPRLDRLAADRRTDDITLLGLAYLQEGRADEAIATFARVQALDPLDVSSANGLSRAYFAKGDTARAEEYRTRTERAQDALTAAENTRRRFVQQSYALEAAWNEKRFEDVIRIARQMLPVSEPKNTPALYEYLVASYKALGRPDEADKALAEARRALGSR